MRPGGGERGGWHIMGPGHSKGLEGSCGISEKAFRKKDLPRKSLPQTEHTHKKPTKNCPTQKRTVFKINMYLDQNFITITLNYCFFDKRAHNWK